MFVLRYSIVLLLVLAFASQFSVFLAFAEVSEDEATSALASAEESVVLAYQAVLKAEEAGANVSSLLVRLNEAGGFLAQARMAHAFGDFDESVRFASSSSDIAAEVQNTAVEYGDLAFGESVRRMWFTTVGSVVGVVLVVFGSFWVWRVFKRRYYRRFLEMRPEVGADES